MRENPSLPLSKSPTLFIVSSGRSGTTLLISILNASQQIHIPYESDFIARAYPFYQQKQNFGDSDYQKLTKLFIKASQPQGWGMTESFLLSYLKQSKPQSFAEVNSAICAAYHGKEGTENGLWGIKAPVLIASINRILSVYPSAKILHIVRDGRDVCLSYQNIHAKSQIKFGPKSLLANALYWIDGLRRIEDARSQQIYEFRYEDLLKNPKVELDKICSFIGIEYDESMALNYYKTEKNSKIDKVQPRPALSGRGTVDSNRLLENIHSKVKQGIDSSNTKKYLTAMPKFNRFVFELIAAPYLQKYNYCLEFPFLNTFLLSPLRNSVYFGARQMNNWRYSKRDRLFYSLTD